MPTPFAKKPGARRRQPRRGRMRGRQATTPLTIWGALPAKKSGMTGCVGEIRAPGARHSHAKSRGKPLTRPGHVTARGDWRDPQGRQTGVFSPFPYSPGRAARLAARNSHWLRHWAGTARHYAASGNACECQSPARGAVRSARAQQDRLDLPFPAVQGSSHRCGTGEVLADTPPAVKKFQKFFPRPITSFLGPPPPARPEARGRRRRRQRAAGPPSSRQGPHR